MNNHTEKLCNLLMLSLALLILTCTHRQLDILKVENQCVNADSIISFNKHLLPIFSTNCALPNCHSGSNPSGNLNLESAQAYSKLNKKGKGYLDTINPTSSVLLSSLNSASNPMPPNGKLDMCTITLVKNWMKQGAKNN